MNIKKEQFLLPEVLLAWGKFAPYTLEKVSADIPARRLGSPKEDASGAIFILENDYVKGRALEIDGGMRV